MGKKIFVSYRRQDSGALAGRIADTIANRFPKLEVFIDVASIEAGQDFREALEQQISLSELMIVVIGPDWLGMVDEEGNQRIKKADDVVRHEIASALKRGIAILPVLVEGAKMPAETDLPADIAALGARQAISVSSLNYRQEVQPILNKVRSISPPLPEHLLRSFSEWPIAPIILGIAIFASLHLYLAKTLGIQTFYTQTIYFPSGHEDATTNVPGLKTARKEVGFFLALNWSLFIFAIMPLMIFLFHSVLQEGARLINQINMKQMLVYIDPDGRQMPRPATDLWTLILRRTSLLIVFIAGIAFMLAVLQWYLYSGQWYFNGFQLGSFLRVSTGPDWQVGWALDSTLARSGGAITLYALVCYLLYGIGWATMFGFYFFLFIFVSELESVAQRVGAHKSTMIRVSPEEEPTGGFGSLARIQRYHSWFCILSVVNMLLMSIRNLYLPPHCYVPNPVSPDVGAVPAHCTSMVGMLGSILANGIDTVGDLLRGDMSAPTRLFFQYGPQNDFTLGPLFHVLLIAVFFIFISEKMKKVVAAARENSELANPRVAAPLMSTMRTASVGTALLLAIGGLAAAFINLTAVYVACALVYLMLASVLKRLAA